MFIKTLTIASLVAFGIGGAANAASLTLDFPSASSTSISSTGGEFFFAAGDYVEQTFTDTGVFDLTSLDFGLNLAANSLTDSAFVNFDVLVNGGSVGDFTINDGDGLGQFDFAFGFVDLDTLNDDYTIRFGLINTVPSGDGSVSFALADSSVTLADVAAVPLPAGLPLLLGALGIMGVASRHRKAA